MALVWHHIIKLKQIYTTKVTEEKSKVRNVSSSADDTVLFYHKIEKN